VGVLAVSVGVVAVFVGRGRVLLGLLVLPVGVVVGRRVVAGGVQVMLDCRVFVFGRATYS
jgi:hypothetical protein